MFFLVFLKDLFSTFNMPFRKRTSGTAKRRKAYAKRNLSLRRKVRHRRRRLPPLAFPKSKLVRLKYCDSVTLNPGATGVASHYFAANGLFRPDLTISGHQPRGYDEWMAVYDHYTVIGSKIRVQAVPLGTTSINPMYFGILLDDNQLMEDLTGQSVIESAQGRSFAITGPSNTLTGGKHPVQHKRFSAKKFFKKNAIVNADLYRGSTASNPTEHANFGLWAASIAGNDPGSQVFLVEIEYIAVLTERKHIERS